VIDTSQRRTNQLATETPAGKDCIEAKLQAVSERLNGEARAHQIATDARLAKLDQTVEFGLKLVARQSCNNLMT
jgi:hypothetical protein